MLGALASLADRLARENRDKMAAEGCLPAAARHLAVEGARGWLYPVTSESGDSYRLFLWFDGAAYQVKVVEPDVEGRTDHHACHLFPDGRICFGVESAGGMPTLEGAFAKSVLWVNGFSVYRCTARFPF